MHIAYLYTLYAATVCLVKTLYTLESHDHVIFWRILLI